MAKSNPTDARFERIEGALDRAAANLDKVSEHVARGEERATAHAATDERFYAQVGKNTDTISVLTTAVGPLVEMRKWLIAAAVGIMGLFATAGTTLYVNYSNRAETRAEAAKAAAALPIAAEKVEREK